MAWWAVLLLAIAGFGAPARAQDMYAAPPVQESITELPTTPEGWDTVRGSFLRVHGAPRDYAVLLRLARHGSQVLPELADTLAVPIGDTIHVYVADTEARFRELQPGDAPTWADATAYPGLGVIFMRAPSVRTGMSKPMEQVFEHELVHVLLGRAFAPASPPLWLQEGVAQVMANEFTPDTTRRLARGLMGNDLFTLTELSRGFPADPLAADLAYAQSADFISWLQVTYGPGALGVLVSEMARGAAIEKAVRVATGSFLDDVEKDWSSRFRSGVPLSITPLTNVDIWFALAGLMLIVGGIMRRIQFKRRLVEMEAEERLVDDLLAQMATERRLGLHRPSDPDPLGLGRVPPPG